MDDASLVIYSTCPPSSQYEPATYRKAVRDVASWSERYGCYGILVYADNSLADPWCIAQMIIEETASLRPLVAVQPIYMHPYAVAKKVATLGWLHGRAVALNLVAGGFRNDLVALGDATPHDRRYDRLVEYAAIVKALLAGAAVSVRGEFYAVDRPRLAPPLPNGLFPAILVSGSSEAGLAAARTIGAVAVLYPRPAVEYAPAPATPEAEPPGGRGLRVGIIARDDAGLAWRIARVRFPEERKGRLTQQLATKVSDSVWRRQLAGLGREAKAEGGPYWLVPFENYKTMCPYLVGSHAEVAAELARYLSAGFQTIILDVPASEDDLAHARRALAMAGRGPAR